MGNEDKSQYTFSFDDAYEKFENGDPDDLNDVSISFGAVGDYGEEGPRFQFHDEDDEKDEINERLKRIEKVLGIPADLERNKEMEQKHPHLKEMAEAYNLAVEQHITLELLTPPEPEEEMDDIPF